MKNLQLIIEKGEEGLYGRIEGRKSFLPVTYGHSKQEVIENLKELIKDYQQHEKDGDAFWLKLDVNKIEFEILFDLQSFFAEHDFLNVSSIARHAGMNESLVRQYASGKKFPSTEQTKKIETVIKSLAKDLNRISLFA